jgi:glycosyltransferase involved in cell wall biosynthesis
MTAAGDMGSRVPRIAWFSPLPPASSGIADYTFEILPFFVGRAAVDVFCRTPRLGRGPRAPAGARVVRPARYLERRTGYDACFYHLGNNPHHEFVYRAAEADPQIAVFHDAVLHHLVAHMTFESGRDPLDYEGILREEYSDVGARLATLRHSRLATDFEKFLFPLTGHLAKRARGIVVHSHDAAAWLRLAAPDVPVAVIPHHAAPPPLQVAGIDRQEARRLLGLPADAFIAAHLGFITRPKQPGTIVGGFDRLRREFPDSLLLMVGADYTRGALRRLVNSRRMAAAVRLTGYVDLAQMYLFIRAADVAINLRYPSAGETSGTLARAMAEGRVVVVNNYASWAELPGDVVLKIEIDGPQTEQLGDHLLRLARDPALRSSMEVRARQYAAQHLDPVRCVDRYLSFAAQVSARGSVERAVPQGKP